MLDRLVGDGEFTKVVTDHFGLDFDLVENLSVVDTDDRSNHFRDNDHITKVSLDNLRLLILTTVELSLTQALNQSERLTLKTTIKAATSATVDKVDELGK